MDIHQNARLTPHGRAELVRRVLVVGQAPKAVAGALGVTVKTVSKWCARFRAEPMPLASSQRRSGCLVASPRRDAARFLPPNGAKPAA